MKSKAQFKSHPIHPMLVGFPIAFFIGAFVFDLLSWCLNKDSFADTSRYLIIAGLISGIAAAVPGFIDFLYTVPPKSSGSKRAAKHGLINATVLLLFGLTLFLKYRGSDPLTVLIIELAGVILLGISGWLGGTLVYRNEIGVDRRYAAAGKWNVKAVENGNGIVEVASVDELQPDQMKLVLANDKRIVLARTEKEYVAFDDRCTHRGGSLAAGAMICGRVQCPWHGSQFDVTNGTVKAGPAKENISTYKVEERKGRIYIHIPG